MSDLTFILGIAVLILSLIVATMKIMSHFDVKMDEMVKELKSDIIGSGNSTIAKIDSFIDRIDNENAEFRRYRLEKRKD